MSIARKVIDEICLQAMFVAHGLDGRPLEHPVIFVWNSNAEEQLDAVIENEIAKRDLEREANKDRE